MESERNCIKCISLDLAVRINLIFIHLPLINLRDACCDIYDR